LFHLSKLLNFKEKLFVLLLVFVVLASLFFWLYYLYSNLTISVPRKGGIYTEGIIGQPNYINPLLAQASEADSDLSQLIFSGLLKYDKDGNLVNDLAASYEISENQSEYTVHLKQNLKWHDGSPLTADDVFFTVNAIKDPMYKSPLRQAWQGIEIRQADENTLVFSLKSPYFGFLDNLTAGILPKHIWENISPDKFALTEYNLRPIGSGPFVFSDLNKDSEGNILSYELQSFADYHDVMPYISRFNLNFYQNEESLLQAFNKKEIDGMSNISPNSLQDIKTKKSADIHEFVMPRYYALFFNQTKNLPLADKKVREALAWGVNRQEIIDSVLKGKGTAIFSPFLPQMEEYENDISKYDFNIDKAREVLDAAGWKEGDGGIREKNKTKLEFDIYALDWPELAQTADILKNQWSKIGVSANVNVLAVSDLQQNYIRPREYDSLLFGQALSFNPDPYFFWHSSQKRDPGLNLSLFEDKKADELLESARMEVNKEKRVENYRELQKIITSEIPALFLYSNTYLYPVNQKVKGLTVRNINAPSWRFADVNMWYIKTKRVKK